MPGLADVLLAPLRAAELVVRLADDVHALAERARRSRDPVEEVVVPLQEAVDLLGRLNVLLAEQVSGGRDLNASVERMDAHLQEQIAGGKDLTETAKRLESRTAELAQELDGIETATRPLQRFGR